VARVADALEAQGERELAELMRENVPSLTQV
jgi:hypothetical protein